MIFFAEGSSDAVIDALRASQLVDHLIVQLRSLGPLRRVLLVPPDRTRADSGAGELTVMLYEKLNSSTHVDVLPATGTHKRMEDKNIAAMFPGVPREEVLFHDHEHDLTSLGTVPAAIASKLSNAVLTNDIPIRVNRLLGEGGYDRIVSIGQLVPHEVIGIANHCKNIFIGLGSRDLIHASHYLGAVYGMERIMGRVRTPVRSLLEHVAENYGQALQITYLLTVRTCDEFGKMTTRGLFAGDDNECYMRGAELCRAVNLFPLDRPAKKVVAWMNPEQYTTGWVANKAIYRTRMAIADGGELIVLAPGMAAFGENATQDALIRKHGFRGTPATLNAMRSDPALAANLGVVAHLIHGSSEGRFTITYCPRHLDRNDIEGVGFQYGDLSAMQSRIDPTQLRTGWNMVDGKEVYFVRNPGQGLWGTKEKLEAY
jgi:nickel-dependent lactate racemase